MELLIRIGANLHFENDTENPAKWSFTDEGMYDITLSTLYSDIVVQNYLGRVIGSIALYNLNSEHQAIMCMTKTDKKGENQMNDLITINGKSLAVKEYKGKRVVTLKEIDTVHERADGTARKRFNDNKKYFIDGEDFFRIDQPSEIRTLGITRPQGGIPESVILITESGYLMLVKSFTDDLAWTVQRELVNSYFRSQSSKPDSYTISDPIERAQRWIEEQQRQKQLETTVRAQEQMIGELKPKADYTDDILQNKGLVTISQIAKDYGMSGKALNKLLSDYGIQYKQSGQWLLYSKYHDKGYTHSNTIQITRSDGRPDIKMETKWTQKGRLFLYNTLKAIGIEPLIEMKGAST